MSNVELPAGWEVGTVKVFGKEDRFGGLYGFLVLSDGEETFFHADGRGTFIKGAEGVGLIGSLEFSMEVRRHPKKGDKIVFFSLYDRAMPWRRPKADPWGFADEYEEVKRQVDSKRAIATAT